MFITKIFYRYIIYNDINLTTFIEFLRLFLLENLMNKTSDIQDILAKHVILHLKFIFNIIVVIFAIVKNILLYNLLYKKFV